MYPTLNFPAYAFRIRENKNGAKEIFDRVRKKFVALTPEEWVRQHLLEYLIQEKKFPLSLMAVEKQLKLNSTVKRTDLLVYNNSMSPIVLAECKAPEVNLDVQTLNQILRYNLVFKVRHLIVTNGLQHYVFLKDIESDSWSQGNDFPSYQELA
ncbi:MAG: type I restriction enzyme HsdR N-terminal domain-containing protein [Bacteroidota bacterium]